MALLEDPTIQRILDEVNKAASGGIFGLAGNYMPEQTGGVGQIESSPTPSNAYFDQQQQQQQQQHQAPLFYPTPEMFGIDDSMAGFDSGIDMNSMGSVVPIATPSSFDLYSAGLYNTMPQSFMSPYENYNGMTSINNSKHDRLNTNNNTIKQMPTVSTVSSGNNDGSMGHHLTSSHHHHQQHHHHHHHHQEYPTIPPLGTRAMPNLGLNVRTTLPNETSSGIDETEVDLTSEPIANETTDTATATIDLVADKDDNGVPLSTNNDNGDFHVDQQHLGKIVSSASAGQIFYDPNPQIIQRKGSHSVTYKQNIIVRFLQPPPIANAGPLVIKEVRSPQPPPLPPLVIKQRPTPPKTPPPLVIREKPPPLPATLAAKVITRQLPPEPAPPRAVIIERLPPLPAKPRDIILERWLPYQIVNQKRKVIVQRAPKSSKDYPQMKNVIITYEPVQAKIVRHFQKMKVTREDPQMYTNRYGTQLCEPAALVQQARAAGILEDLGPPPSFTSNTTVDLNFEMVNETANVDEQSHELHHDGVEGDESSRQNQHSSSSGQEASAEHLSTTQQQQDIDRPTSTSPVVADETVQEEEFVEENVTPFYMNSGENLQQTLHRLGIDLPENIVNEHTF